MKNTAQINDCSRFPHSLLRQGGTIQLEFCTRARVHVEAQIHQFVVQLSESWNILPSALFIEDIRLGSTFPVAGGGFADIFKGSWRGDVEVAVKRLRLHAISIDKRSGFSKRVYREAIIWRQLHHPYVLPFFGAYRDPSQEMGLCLLSPWMLYGNILEYLSVHRKSVEIDQLLLQIAEGLEYLHKQNVVHGDMRGANILIDETRCVRIADFGLAIFAESFGGTFKTSTGAGTTRWMAPELLDPKKYDKDRARRTYQSDVYAFGHVCLEVYTGRPPFSDISAEPVVITKVLNGERPELPLDCQLSPLASRWPMLEQCWNTQPEQRPTMQELIKALY
ncbi:hypothetical protein JAAARDRAFT_256104 [Jaapia argillacea MUCL 33604]|uniref:Protein kinase domain-containing protein n=1 Tax=Jaapia argillacea MUCL 33604 TaxID=933084 RepID=A0A067Q627_9AGAM|nr:hypothetical protein JAAARDRAFT_256104 [Jaapia argillacea MUCL 33604]